MVSVLARNMVQTVNHPACGPIKLVGPPVKFSVTPPSIRSPPPTLGQHTDEVLRELLRLDDAHIERLKAEGVVC